MLGSKVAFSKLYHRFVYTSFAGTQSSLSDCFSAMRAMA